MALGVGFKKISHHLTDLFICKKKRPFVFSSTSYKSCIELPIMFYIFMPRFLGNEKEEIVSLQRIREFGEVSRSRR
jgi:hypothetical protein